MSTSHTNGKGGKLALSIAALGIVFGDIGTSPLYALKECFSAVHGIPFSKPALLGVISLIIWAITIMASLKYMMFVLRADNKGEGGILALMALSLRNVENGSRKARILLMLGAFGACMFYGDAVISPAVSILSAMEGIAIAAPEFDNFIVPLAVVILTGLFAIQRHGTGTVGKVFGPVMIVWFTTLGLLGMRGILASPEVLLAFNPYYALFFLTEHSVLAFTVLGFVVLVLTGVEAVYADMGHFGIRPIRRAWFYMVMPCLLLNYIGQGGYMLANPEAVTNPFYMMVPKPLLLPVIALATLATIIAAQAVISGAYSLTSQAILLGFVPRMKIQHTSEDTQGQIYMPLVNWMLWVAIMILVLQFRTSSNLAAAYGLAVTITMVITTMLAAVVMHSVWKWSPVLVSAMILLFFALDVTFFTANLLKVPQGGWLPLVIGGTLYFLMMTWYRGRMLLRSRIKNDGIPLVPFMQSLLENPPHRVAGTAVFMTSNIHTVPVALLHNIKHNRILHDRVIFMKISIWDEPYVDDDKRLSLTEIGGNVYRLRAAFGFKEVPDINRVLVLASREFGMKFDLMDTSFFLARDTIVPTHMKGMSMWREYLFAWMYQNAAKTSDWFRIPSNRIVELGSKIEI